VFKNRVLKRIFGPKRDKVTGEWRGLHNGELNDLYPSPNILLLLLLLYMGPSAFAPDAPQITKYYSGDQLQKNEVGGACSTYG
jgi:hypothetical protein